MLYLFHATVVGLQRVQFKILLKSTSPLPVLIQTACPHTNCVILQQHLCINTIMWTSTRYDSFLCMKALLQPRFILTLTTDSYRLGKCQMHLYAMIVTVPFPGYLFTSYFSGNASNNWGNFKYPYERESKSGLVLLINDPAALTFT